MPSITVLLRETPDVAAALHEMTEAVGARASAPRPVHAASGDPRSKRYYTLETADDAAQDVVAALRRCPSVEAAFIKPRDAPP